MSGGEVAPPERDSTLERARTEIATQHPRIPEAVSLGAERCNVIS